MASFDELLNDLNHGYMEDEFYDNDGDITAVVVTEKREFILPENFDTVIGYEGDVNSQIVTFALPGRAEGHYLEACTRELRWKNLASGLEGTSPLLLTIPENETPNGEQFYVKWECPPELFIKAGTIEISIIFYDIDSEGRTIFSWSTSTYSGFSVAKSMDSVQTQAFPARNEILMIDKETKQILAPAGYNNVICNFGDVGVANVYFLVNRYLGKNEDLDVTESEITIYISINGYRKKDILTNGSYRLYSPEISDRNKEGLVFIDWEVPAELTTSEQYGPGNLQIALEFVIKDGVGEGAKIKKRWFSNIYNDLRVANSIIQVNPNPGDPAVTTDTVYRLIEEFFEVNDIVFE